MAIGRVLLLCVLDKVITDSGHEVACVFETIGKDVVVAPQLIAEFKEHVEGIMIARCCKWVRV